MGKPQTSKNAKTDKPPLGPNGFKYKPQFGAIVVCDGEAHQKDTYDRRKASGYSCRVVVA